MPTITPNAVVRDIPDDARIVIDRTFRGTANADAGAYYDRKADVIHIAADKANNMADAANWLSHENEHRARPVLSTLARMQDAVLGLNLIGPNSTHQYFFNVGNSAQDLYIRDARQGLVPIGLVVAAHDE